jgi:hypothetical protein
MRPEISKVLTTMLTDPNIDQTKALQLADVFTKFGMQQAPKGSTRTQENPEYNTIITDSQGKVTVEPGTGKPQEISEYEKNPDGTLKVYVGPSGQKEYNKITYKNGKKIKEDREQLSWEPKGNNVTIDNTSVAEAMRKMNIDRVTGEITKAQEDYKLAQEEQDNTEDPKKKQKAEELKKRIMGTISQKTDELTQSIAQQFPTFYPTIEAYLADPELIKNPDKIDEVISKDMKGLDPSLILLTKNVVKARLFK